MSKNDSEFLGTKDTARLDAVEKEFQEYNNRFESYFSKNGFKHFEQVTGWSVSDFKQGYREFANYVNGYYNGFCVARDYQYGEDQVRFPLKADIMCYENDLDFYVSMSKDCRVSRSQGYPILEDEYFITLPPTKLKFKDCNAVMKELLRMDYLDKTYYKDIFGYKYEEGAAPYEES